MGYSRIEGISLRKIRIILSSAKSESFTMASVKENLSQPAVTNTIKEVEETIGKNIFLKQGNVRTPRLSSDGEYIIEIFEEIISNYEKNMNAIKDSLVNKKKCSHVLIQEEILDELSSAFLEAIRMSVSGSDPLINCSSIRRIRESVDDRSLALGIVDSDPMIPNTDYFTIGSNKTALYLVSDEENEYLMDRILQADEWGEFSNDLLLYSNIGRSHISYLKKIFKERNTTRKEFSSVRSDLMMNRLIFEQRKVGLMKKETVHRVANIDRLIFKELPGSTSNTQIGAIIPWGNSRQVKLEVLKKNAYH